MRFVIVCLSFLFLSCDPDFEGDTRLVLDIAVAQQNENSVSGVEVNLSTDYDGTTLISYGDTDSAGNIRFVFPKSKGGNYSIEVEETDVYLAKKLINFRNADFVDFTYTVNPFVLYRKDEATILQIVPNRVSQANLLSVRATNGTVPIVVDLNPQQEPVDGDYFFKTRYDVFKNDTVDIRYLVEENGVITEFMTSVDVGNEPVTFSLSY